MQIFSKIVMGVGMVVVFGALLYFIGSKPVEEENTPVITTQDKMEKFTEVNGKFTFEHDSLFKVYQPESSLSTDWRLNAKQKGVLLARVSIPRVYMLNTNFSNAYLTIGASTDPKEINACIAGASSDGEVKTVSGYPFSKFTSEGVGAGNLYETVSYRGLLDGDCYAIEYTIHSTNISNYSSDQNIKEFDKVKIQNEFESIIESFDFLVNSD